MDKIPEDDMLHGDTTSEQDHKVTKGLARLFSANEPQAVAGNLSTIEEYSEYKKYDRESRAVMFSNDGCKALADGFITLKKFFEYEAWDRTSLAALFSDDGRRAVAEGFITIEKFLEYKAYDRKYVAMLFSDDGRKAVAEGFITIEKFLEYKSYDRRYVAMLFSDDRRKALADGFITIEKFLETAFNDRVSFLEKNMTSYLEIRKNASVMHPDNSTTPGFFKKMPIELIENIIVHTADSKLHSVKELKQFIRKFVGNETSPDEEMDFNRFS
jgi:hypothetical protein